MFAWRRGQAKRWNQNVWGSSHYFGLQQNEASLGFAKCRVRDDAGFGHGDKKRRSEVDRAAKEALVTSLHDVFQNTGVVVVTHYAGLSVAEMSDYRNRMREAGGHVKVAKNRLAKIALEGTSAAGITDLMTGPTCLAYSDDPIAAAKISVEYAKQNEKLVICGGSMGETVLDVDGVKALAALPSLDEIRGTLVGLLQAPMTKIVRVVNEPSAKVARVIQAKSAQDQAA